MRNIENNVEKGKEIIRKHSRADLSVNELHALLSAFEETDLGGIFINDAYEAVTKAFYMGVAVGARNA